MFTLSYSTYARASKVFEYFSVEGDTIHVVGMCKGKDGYWKVMVAC